MHVPSVRGAVSYDSVYGHNGGSRESIDWFPPSASHPSAATLSGVLFATRWLTAVSYDGDLQERAGIERDLPCMGIAMIHLNDLTDRQLLTGSIVNFVLLATRSSRWVDAKVRVW